MSDHVRLTPEHFRAVVTAVEDALAGGATEAQIPWGPAELTFETRADGSLSLSGPDGGSPMSLYVRPDKRPEGYPKSVPFLPGEFVTVGASDGQVAVTWWAPADPAATLGFVHDEAVSSGWTVERDVQGDAPSSRQRLYRKGGLRRFVSATDGALALIEPAG